MFRIGINKEQIKMLKNNHYHIILASNSPRRKELLSGIDVPYEVHALPNLDESYPETLAHENVAEYLARKKALAYSCNLKNNTLLITADTIVLLHDKILEKPLNKADAKQMLRKLSGKTHRVITGVCLTTKEKQISFSDTANVTFGNLSNKEINYYVEKYNPMDKAGAYGVQEWIGYVAVERIDGSYFNVMGLPIFKVYHAIKQF